jgi:phosphoenolpyruvate carboxylase
MSSQRLRSEISMLGELLGSVIRQIHGQESLDLIENIRTVSRDARAGDDAASKSLRDTISGLTLEEMRLVIRSFSVFLDLANLAEDRERIRVLQDRTRESHPDPRSESIRDAIQTLKEAGETAESIQQLIDNIDIELVFTAHPTEAKRRSLRSKLRSIREILCTLDQNGAMTLVSTPRPGPIEQCCRSGAVLALRNSAPRRQAPRWRLWLVFRFLANKHASTGASPVVSVQLLNLCVGLRWPYKDFSPM